VKFNTKVITGGLDAEIYLWDRSNGKVLSKLKSHSDEVTKVLFSPTNQTFVSTSKDKTTKIWNLNEDKYEVTNTLKNHQEGITGLCFHPSGEYFITCSKDQTWCLQDVAQGLNIFQSVQQQERYSTGKFSCNRQ
jgi:WD40 repeat protein